jgi:signal transduction histidine kinase/CheY-like chemotaxis protein
VTRDLVRPPFTSDDEALLFGVADRVAVGIDNARLLDVSQTQARELQALLEATKQILGAFDLPTVLSTILENVLRLTAADDASVWLLDERGKFLKLEMARGASTDSFKAGALVNEGLAWEALQSGKVLNTSDYRSLPHLVSRHGDVAGARSAVAVPLPGRQERIGALLIWSREPAHFTAAHESTLSSFAEYAALGIVQSEELAKRTTLEQQLLQSHKMEAIGRLAGGVAHDFNNLLTTISGFGELALLRLPSTHPVREYVDEIVQAGDRAAALTRQLLAVSRRQPVEPRVLDLNAVVTETERMLRRLIREDVELTTNLDPALGRVEADPSQIQQIVMNLIVNARDAIPGAGRLSIETGNIDLDESYTRDHISVRPGSYVMLAVTDTGVGMDAETLGHIFEPFYTTKPVGQGTGLGLSTVYGIVKQCGGDIWVYSEVGRGTTFKIYLPRVKSLADLARTREVQPSLPTGSETVLVIEDEDRLRSLACLVLQSAGYKILEAPRGDLALQIAEHQQGAIDLVLTDLVMPGMSGQQVAERLQMKYPHIRVLFMSGYTDDIIVRNGMAVSDVSFLQKPFSPAGLTRKVREVLDSREAAAG